MDTTDRIIDNDWDKLFEEAEERLQQIETERGKILRLLGRGEPKESEKPKRGRPAGSKTRKAAEVPAS